MEETIIAYLRWPVFSEIYRMVKNGVDSALFSDIEIKSFADIQNILSYDFLRSHVYEIGEFFNIMEEA